MAKTNASVSNKIRHSKGENIFNVFNIIIMIVMMFVCAYPFWYVICASFSNADALVLTEGLIWWPVKFDLLAFERVLQDSQVWIGYGNTIFYVVVGTFVNIIMTVLCAYFVSRSYEIPGKKAISIMIVFTMYFSAGMIPGFLNIQDLKLYDTRWSIVLPGAINVFNMVIMRTAMQSIDASMEESAQLDGASQFTILFKIMLPLTKATIAVLVLYYGVAHWNSWFNAMLYLQDSTKHPLQLYLRQVLMLNETSATQDATDSPMLGESIRYANIVVATVPILLLYPFLQKYFVKGMMVGAVKG
jgi:putative aldouronate transport system permease protein